MFVDKPLSLEYFIVVAQTDKDMFWNLHLLKSNMTFTEFVSSIDSLKGVDLE